MTADCGLLYVALLFLFKSLSKLLHVVLCSSSAMVGVWREESLVLSRSYDRDHLSFR